MGNRPVLTLSWLLVASLGLVTGADDQCEGDGCPTAMADQGSSYEFATFLFSGIACAVLLFDLANRYIFTESKDEIKPGDQQPAAFSAVKPSPQPVEEVIQQEQAQTVTSSSPSSQAAAPYKLDDAHGSDKTKEEEPAAVTDLVANLLECLRSGVDLHSPTDENVPAPCKEKLSRIAELEDSCNALSNEFDQSSVALVRNDTQEDQPEAEQSAQGPVTDSLLALQKSRSALRSQWTAIRRLFFCADVHLRNATAYQEFFYEIDELQRQLEQFNASNAEKVAEDAPKIETPEDLEKVLEEAEKTLRAIKLWDAHALKLVDESRNIVPVHMRSQPVQDPLPVRLLCAYKTPKIPLEEGETVLLVNNDDHKRWQVQNSAGDQEELPAVCCLVPPPDVTAVRAAAKLRHSMQEVYTSADALYRKRLTSCSSDVLRDFIEKKMDMYKNLTPEHKDDFLDKLRSIEDTLNKYFPEHEAYEDLTEMVNTVKTLVQAASTEGPEDEAFLKEVLGMITNLEALMSKYKLFAKSSDNFKKLNFSLVLNSGSLSEEDWDTLDDVDQARAKEETCIDVNVQREHAAQSDATSLMSASGEVRQTFSIRAVKDPRDGTEMSMDDAVARGIVNQRTGMYVNLKTREEMPIPQAMNQGFILVESTQTKKTRELTQAVGIVSVTFTRETRPYTVRRVRDPRSDEDISVDEALELGIFDASTGVYKNPDTKEEMSIENAIDSGGLIVEYADTETAAEPEVITKTFAVNAVLDRKSKKRLPFFEACEKGLIDKEAGQYHDNITGEAMTLVDAGKKGFVRVKIIDDAKQIDLHMSKKLSASSDSLNSESSIGTSGTGR